MGEDVLDDRPADRRLPRLLEALLDGDLFDIVLLKYCAGVLFSHGVL